MQLASHGARRAAHLARGGPVPNPGGGTVLTRALHAPSFVPRPPPTTAQTAKQLVSKSRHLVSRFFAHLTAPGLGHPARAHASRLHTGAVHARGIQQGLSMPARHALGRPLGAPMLPRAPTMPRPNAVTNVGLGTARNFHAARPIFASLAENVPVAGRALWEAGWDTRMQKERASLASKKAAARGETKKSKDKAKPIVRIVREEKENATDDELSHYFAAAPAAPVTTHLLVPLAPTPTARAPLDPDPSRVPFRALAHMHADHALHATRVSALFARLDQNSVWDRGAECHAYSSGADGTANVLQVEFKGWKEQEVRGVIGECGTGWCVMEEFREAEVDSVLDEASSIASGAEHEHDTAHAYVVPTLDFSSAFLDAAPSPAPSDHLQFPDPGSDVDYFSAPASDVDYFSGPGSGASSVYSLSAPGSSVDLVSAPPSTPSSVDMVSAPSSVAPSWVGFSSAFSSRIGSEWGGHDEEMQPRETMF